MTTTVLRTVYPVDVFDSEVAGAPLITRAGVAVDDTLVSAVQTAATHDGVTLLTGGASVPVVPTVTYPLDSRYARRRRGTQPGKVAIGGRNVCQRPNITVTGNTHHKTIPVYVSATDLVFRFTNYNVAAVKEAAAASAVTIRASVRVNGQNHEITKNGNRDLVITTGYLDSDPVAVEVTAGTSILVSTFLSSGTPYSTGFSASGNTYGDTVGTGDLTAPTATPGTGTSASLYGPSLILGTPANGVSAKPVVAIIGDSIARGYSDSGSWGADGGGFIVRALEAASLPWVMGARFTSSAQDWTDVYGRKIRLGMLADCDYAVINLGINDILNQAQTALQTETSLISVANGTCAKRGIRAYVCTIGPSTSSTDNWATLVNQTVNASDAIRIAYNGWIRAGCPVDNATSLTPVAVGTGGALLAGQTGHPVAGYFEVADTIESARDSGKWKVDGNANTYAFDGTHPFTGGHAAMSAAINTALFV